MSKNNRDCKKLNNEGFSLVEVLVAVIILALVAGPILMAFVMSARFNARARETQRVSAVAESVMEEFKGMSIKDARSGVSGYTDITPIDSASFVFTGNKTVDSNSYDVRVTATPLRDKEAENLNGADTSKDSYINDAFMDPYSTYVFTQDLYQDKQIYDEVLNNVYTYLDDNYDFSEVNPGVSASELDKDKINLDRVVVLEITGDEDSQIVKVLYYYNYNITNYPVPGYGDVSFTFAQIFYEAPAKTYKDLKKAYLFYSPGYKSIAARQVALI
ncbi:MAG: prepilin-type N-terminal cleavage/methylation domain-containing protein, partial [Lachnospiraceae bacterium]|nr:prepilin-type N-terminal cleavage/methylation domain-containing protein [Lachnospiraceae bacterium]